MCPLDVFTSQIEIPLQYVQRAVPVDISRRASRRYPSEFTVQSVAGSSQQRKTLSSDQQKDLLSDHSILWYLGRSPIAYCRAGDGIRTHDILLGKQMLCQLSYTRD